MQLLIFIISYPFFWLLSILPFRVLYLISDVVYFLIYHVFGYRKKIVRQNIAMTLPHLSEKERLRIEKKSFQHFCDIFLEMIKTMNISDKEINERFIITNLDLFLELEKKQKSIALMCAHYASYEWVISMNKKINYQGFAIYKKVNNKYFDKLVKDIRSRFNAKLISTRESIPTIEQNFKTKQLGVYGFASDQSPMLSKTVHWKSFLGIEVPVHVGAEILAKRYDMNVVFLKVKKLKRGYYEATLELITEEPKSIPNYQITDDFMERVEKEILEAPEYYLWTHNRWKHRKQ